MIQYVNSNQEFGKEKIPGGYSRQGKLNNESETWEGNSEMSSVWKEKWEGMLCSSDGPEAGLNIHKSKTMMKVEINSGE